MFKVTDEVMNKLEIPRALDGIVLIGVSGQRHNVEQGGICHCLHSLAVWASNLDKMTQCSRADSCAFREQGLAERRARKGKLLFSGKELVALTGTMEQDEQSRRVPVHRCSTQQEL